MAFMLYEVRATAEKDSLHFTGEYYSLAGHNILKRIWEKNGRPLNKGWHASSDEMIAEWAQGQHSALTRRLLVDASPNTKDRIEIIEIRDVWAYTRGDVRTQQVWWTPLMLNVRWVFVRDGVRDMSAEERQALVYDIQSPAYTPENREFLYLQGDDRGWNWGMSGRTNAPYLEPEVRDYFRPNF